VLCIFTHLLVNVVDWLMSVLTGATGGAWEASDLNVAWSVHFVHQTCCDFITLWLSDQW